MQAWVISGAVVYFNTKVIVLFTVEKVVFYFYFILFPHVRG